MEIRCRHIDLRDVQDQLVWGAVDLGVLTPEGKECDLGAQGLKVSPTVANCFFSQLREEVVLELWVPAFSVDGEDAMAVLMRR